MLEERFTKKKSQISRKEQWQTQKKKNNKNNTNNEERPKTPQEQMDQADSQKSHSHTGKNIITIGGRACGNCSRYHCHA